MQYKIEMNQDFKCVLVTAHGIACGEDFINITRDLIDHASFEQGTPVIHDYTEISTEKISTKDVRTISNFVKTNKEQFVNSRWALIFNDDLGFGLARMWQSITEMDVNFQIRIFKDKEEAFKWVMRDPEDEAV